MSQTGRFAHRTRVHRYVFRYLVVVVALVFSATLLTSVRVAANDGDFVPTFDNEGFVTTDFSEFDQINDIAIQPDGKIVAVGRTFDGRFQSRSRMMVTRYNADGSLDTTFGSDGIVTAGEVGTNAKANCVALQADGKIIVGGRGDFIFGPGFALLRYNTDGSLDETFGFGGIGTGGDGSPSSEIVDVAIQSDGKIVVTGGHTDLVFRFLLGATVVRYTTDGWPDETFDGRKINDLRGRPQFASEGIAIQADQKIVIAGACVVNSFNQTCLARYNSDGSLDNTFGHDGVVATSFSTALGEGDEGARDVAIQPDGKIVIAGVSFDPLGPFPLLARYNTNGSLDPHFFVGRMSFAFPQFSANAVALAPDGKIVIAGEASNPFISPFIGIARYHSDGFIDDTFENGGTAAIHVGIQSAATTVAVQADGKTLLGTQLSFGTFAVSLLRLNEDGSVDSGFNTTSNAVVNSIVIEPDGKIVVGGQFDHWNKTPRSRLARLNSDGSLDETFTPGNAISYAVKGIARLNDGRYLVGGINTPFSDTAISRLTRHNADGTLDASFTTKVKIWSFADVIHVQPDGKILVGGEFTFVNAEAQKAVLGPAQQQRYARHIFQCGPKRISARDCASGGRQDRDRRNVSIRQRDESLQDRTIKYGWESRYVVRSRIRDRWRLPDGTIRQHDHTGRRRKVPRRGQLSELQRHRAKRNGPHRSRRSTRYVFR